MYNFIKANLGKTRPDDILGLIEQAVKHNDNCNNCVQVRIGTEPEGETYFCVCIEREFEDEGECSMSDILYGGYGNTLYEAVQNMIEDEVVE